MLLYIMCWSRTRKRINRVLSLETIIKTLFWQLMHNKNDEELAFLYESSIVGSYFSTKIPWTNWTVWRAREGRKRGKNKEKKTCPLNVTILKHEHVDTVQNHFHFQWIMGNSIRKALRGFTPVYDINKPQRVIMVFFALKTRCSYEKVNDAKECPLHIERDQGLPAKTAKASLTS